VVVVAAVAAVGLALVVMSGCTATTAAPKPISESELNERVRIELDRQWGYTGLDGLVQRPRPEVEKISPSDGFSAEFGECMGGAGFSTWGAGPVGLDMSSVNADGAKATPEQQLAFYGCTARFPSVDRLSRQQLQFIYDYYRGWLIPCIEQRGYAVTDVPSRETFSTSTQPGNWRWSPYGALANRPGNDREWSALERDCPVTIPGMDGWSDPYSFF